MAGTGTRATATDYNNVQSSIANIMGVGSGTNGYGQPITSSQVSPGAVISSAQWNNLRNDLIKARTHQSGCTVVDGLATTYTGSPWQVLQIITSSTAVSEAIRGQYTSFSTGVAGAVATVNSNPTGTGLPPGSSYIGGQLAAPTAISTTTRSTSWGAPGALTISHTVTVTFPGYTSGSLTVSAADHMRCFFNAGGYLQVTASLAGGTSATAGTKDADWKNMLSGFVSYNLSNTSSSLGAGGAINAGSAANPAVAPGIFTAVGFTSLVTGNPASYALVQGSSFSKYLENRYTIQLAKPTTNTLTFLITFLDNDLGDQVGIGAGTDESITGTITSTVLVSRPTGAYVSIPTPTASSTVL